MASKQSSSGPRRFSGKREGSIFLGAISGTKVNWADKSHDRGIVISLLLSPVWTLLFTALPVIITFHGVGADIYRFIEPVIGLPLNYFTLTLSEVFTDYSERDRKFLGMSEKGFLNTLFLIGGAVYAQGAGMHAAAIMAKHNLEDLISANPNITSQYPDVNESVDYMRTTLEHIVGHYLYAAGAIIITWTQIIAYRRQRHDDISTISRACWLLGSFFYGVLLSGVAIEFPYGSICGLVYVVAAGTPLLIHLLKTRHLFTWGKRLVLQYYMLSYVIGLIFILIWIAINRGFVDRKEAGYFR